MNDQNEHTNEEADERKASDQIRKRKIIIIILSVLIGILVLGILGYVVFRQMQPSDSIQGTKEKIETTTSKEELKKLYDELIRSSVAAGASEAEILALLEQAATETGDQSYLAQKDSYTIKNPSFSLAPGTYQGAQSLGINKGNSADKVFYTTDGSRPTTGSTEYTTPISLPEGTTTVKAVEVNTKGLISPVLEGQYIIAPANTTETQSNLTSQEFIDKVYGVWYAQEPEHNVVVTISDSEFTFTRYYIDGVINGPYTVVSTTDNGGTISAPGYVEGHYMGDILVQIDFGVLGDNKININSNANGNNWGEYRAAEYLGSGQYRLPFDPGGGCDIVILN